MDIEKKLDKIDNKIDTVIEVNNEQNLTLKGLSVLRETDSKNLEIHIKRTNILESKLNKIVLVLVLGLGAAAYHFGPALLRFFGFFV